MREARSGPRGAERLEHEDVRGILDATETLHESEQAKQQCAQLMGAGYNLPAEEAMANEPTLLGVDLDRCDDLPHPRSDGRIAGAYLPSRTTLDELEQAVLA